MAEAEPVQSAPARDALVAVALLTLLFGWTGFTALFGPSEMNPRHPAITETAFATVCGWVSGCTLAFARRGPGGGWALGASRALYTWGCAMCLLHIAVAFHLAHGWSHGAAWEHTRAVGGYGNGVFVNYLFALVWLADAGWAWVALDSYLNRSRWIGQVVYGFTGFVVFNAGVVFNSGFSRAVCALLFSAVAVMAWSAWRNRPTNQPAAREEMK